MTFVCLPGLRKPGFLIARRCYELDSSCVEPAKITRQIPVLSLVTCLCSVSYKKSEMVFHVHSLGSVIDGISAESISCQARKQSLLMINLEQPRGMRFREHWPGLKFDGFRLPLHFKS